METLKINTDTSLYYIHYSTAFQYGKTEIVNGVVSIRKQRLGKTRDPSAGQVELYTVITTAASVPGRTF